MSQAMPMQRYHGWHTVAGWALVSLLASTFSVTTFAEGLHPVLPALTQKDDSQDPDPQRITQHDAWFKACQRLSPNRIGLNGKPPELLPSDLNFGAPREQACGSQDDPQSAVSIGVQEAASLLFLDITIPTKADSVQKQRLSGLLPCQKFRGSESLAPQLRCCMAYFQKTWIPIEFRMTVEKKDQFVKNLTTLQDSLGEDYARKPPATCLAEFADGLDFGKASCGKCKPIPWEKVSACFFVGLTSGQYTSCRKPQSSLNPESASERAHTDEKVPVPAPAPAPAPTDHELQSCSAGGFCKPPQAIDGK